jgi:hypothetical protein
VRVPWRLAGIALLAVGSLTLHMQVATGVTRPDRRVIEVASLPTGPVAPAPQNATGRRLGFGIGRADPAR